MFITGYAEKIVLDGGAIDRDMRVLTKPFTNAAFDKVIRDILSDQPLAPWGCSAIE
jgi:hypothetical protein